MRVLITGMAMRGKKTGIGYYTAELIRTLRPLLGRRNLFVYSQPWIVSLIHFLRPQKPSGSSVAPTSLQLSPVTQATSTGGGLRKWLKTNFGGIGMRAIEHHRVKFARAGFSLYHEPNFLPLEFDLPTVTSIHDLSVLLHPEWHPAARLADHERNFQRGLARTQHVVTISEFARQEAIQHLGLSPERISRTYMGVRPGLRPMTRTEIAAGRRTLKLPPQYLLYVGTIEPRKNLMMLLRAYCSLPGAVREQYPLVLVGSWGWNSADVADLLDNQGRQKGIHYLGYVPETSLCLLYNAARALVFPSRYEGFGMPPIEMMACSGAVLASTAGAIVETVGSKAHLTDPDDIDGWREALLRICQDDDWWLSLRKGAEEVARPFTWERCAAETLAAYNCVINGQKPKVQAA